MPRPDPKKLFIPRELRPFAWLSGRRITLVLLYALLFFALRIKSLTIVIALLLAPFLPAGAKAAALADSLVPEAPMFYGIVTCAVIFAQAYAAVTLLRYIWWLLTRKKTKA